MKRIIAPLAVAGMLAAGCGHPLIPASALRPNPVANAYQLAPLANYTVKRPVLGVDLYAPRNYSTLQTFTYGVRTISYIKNVLHATSLGIVWAFYAPNLTSNTVRASNRGTLSVSNVITLTTLAKKYGLQVEYRPLIFVSPNSDSSPTKISWEGKLNPRNPYWWFKSYFGAELPYIKAAQKLHVNEFVAATEMHLLNGSRIWSSFFGRVRRIYSGVVSYSAFDNDYLGPRAHLLPVGLYGMDMYKGLWLKVSATSAQVTAAWEKVFKATPAAVLERTALDEEGIAAKAGAYKLPADLGGAGQLDQQVQANWFTAACQTVAHYHMRGVYFFKVDLADNPAEPSRALSVFEGRKGAVAISACAKLFR